jgi:L-gulonate 5-dehydrogenase
MKAIEVIKPGELVISERPMPEAPGAGKAVVRIKAVGICGSDVHIYHGKNPFATYPRVIGHEAVGEIYQVGEGVADFKPGDRVAIDNVLSCGTCYACSVNRHNVCRSVRVLGVHTDGVFQEYLTVDAKNLYRIPADLPWELAATIEPYSIAAEAIDRGQVCANDTVLICGAGAIGLVILQAVKAIGAKAAVMDIVDKRLEKAKSMGADLIINTKTTDLEQAVQEFSGEGVSVVMEATGVNAILEHAIAKLVSQAGRVVVLGFSNEPAQIAPVEITRRELAIMGSRLNNRKFPEVIRWFEAGKVDPSAIVSHVLPVTEVAKGLDLFEHHPEEACKIILKFE